ncbi:MAG: hypothetical protein EZS28_028351, partial [Streblomastix strix]
MIQNEQYGIMDLMAGKKDVEFGPNALDALDALVHFTLILHDSRAQQSQQLIDSGHCPLNSSQSIVQGLTLIIIFVISIP